MIAMKPTSDPRNISDKAFLNNSIKILIEYLLSHNYGHQIAPKTLMHPAVKDFQNIVMFLFQQVDPNFIATGKLEDEVVSIFKYLDYPFNIAKSHITAVGSPHAWPSLLGALMWLIELLAYDEAAGIGSHFNGNNDDGMELEAIDGEEDNEAALEKAFLKYLASSYQLYLMGQDNEFNELESSFVGVFENKNESIRLQIEALEAANESLDAEIEEVEKRRSYLPVLERKRNDYAKDLTKFEGLIEKLEEHRGQLQSKTDARKAELEKLGVTENALQQDCDVCIAISLISVFMFLFFMRDCFRRCVTAFPIRSYPLKM